MTIRPMAHRIAFRKDGIPTRCDRMLMSTAELSITAALEVVERSGASPALTDATMLLSKARDRVADHVEGYEGPADVLIGMRPR